jgi:hypothetical protein
MSPSYWGPSTWLFIHTLASKIKESSFPLIGPNLIMIIVKICNNLPCPECSQHAKSFWANVKTSNIKTKTDLINLIFVFHNTVNKRKKLPMFRYENIGYYNTKNLVNTYNNFARNFNTKGNMNMINESFHRNMMLSSLRTWMLTNISHFD